MRRALKHALAIVLFAAWCMSAATWVVSYQYADEDTGSAVRQARACVELGQCEATGPPTSLQGLHHGASWTRLIAHFLGNGGGLASVQFAVLALLMTSGGVSFLILRRYLSEPAAVLGLLLSLQPVLATARFSELSNATLLPLPLAFYYASTALCVEFGSWIAGAAASAFLVAAMSANLSCAVMVPFHLALVALFARTPWMAVSTACLSLALTFALESYDAVLEIIATVVRVPVTLGLLATAAVVLSFSPLRRKLVSLRPLLFSRLQRWRGRLHSLSVRARMRVAMHGAAVYVSTAVWVGCALVRFSLPEGHYLAPLVFPLLFLVGDAVDQLPALVIAALLTVGFVSLLLLPFAPILPQLWSFIVVLASLLTIASFIWKVGRGIGRDPAALSSTAVFVISILTLATSLPDLILFPRQRLTWPVVACEKLVNDLYKSGYTFMQLMVSLQRQSPATTEYMVTTLDPNLFGPPEGAGDTGWSLLALLVDPAVIARTEGVVLTFPLSHSQSAVVVRAPSYLDRTHLRTCYSTGCDVEQGRETCIERLSGRPPRHAPPYFEVDREEVRAPGKTFSYQPGGRTYCVFFSMPLHTFGSHTPHIVRLLEQWPLRMQIKAVTGVRFDGQLPGLEVRLLDDRESTGTLDVEVSRDTFGPNTDWLEDPPLIEVTAANEHLVEPFRNHLVTRW